MEIHANFTIALALTIGKPIVHDIQINYDAPLTEWEDSSETAEKPALKRLTSFPFFT
jgi:hypothetical protein